MVNVHHTLASGELFHVISDILLNYEGTKLVIGILDGRS